MTLKLSPLIAYYLRNIFMENHAEIAHQRLVSDRVFILVNKPKQSLHTRNYF